MIKTECVFCKIARGVVNAKVVYEDETTLAFLDSQPVAEGHVLVIPKEHYVNLFDIEPRTLERLILTTRRVALLLRDRLHANGINLFHRTGEAGEQTVYHFHIHVIPRKERDHINFNEWWATKLVPIDESGFDSLVRKFQG